MRRSALAGIVVGAIALAACTNRCPRGETLTSYTETTCDDRTRQCVETTYEQCACDPHVARCPSIDAAPVRCRPALSGTGAWEAQAASDVPHVVDGRFSGGEWDDATRLEGLFTDVYMDYQGGRLYFLNDWRANQQGIRDDCSNYFQVRIGADWIDLRVFGDGRVEVRRDEVPVPIRAEGAYAFAPSPDYPQPHTIYEFSLVVDVPDVVICCLDPLLEASCQQLTEEPMAVSLRVSGGATQVRRQIVAGSVSRLGADAACGSQQGICADGLACDDARHVCAVPTRPRIDGGDVDASPPF